MQLSLVKWCLTVSGMLTCWSTFGGSQGALLGPIVCNRTTRLMVLKFKIVLLLLPKSSSAAAHGSSVNMLHIWPERTDRRRLLQQLCNT